MWKMLLALGILAFGLLKLKPLVFPAKAPSIELVDSRGAHWALGGSKQKPMVIGFWISPCAYSDRILKFMNRVRREYKTEGLDVVGVYLNPIDDASLNALLASKKLEFPVVAGQSSLDQIVTLNSSFGMRGAGVDLYLVDKKGRIHAVDAGQADVKSRDIENDLNKIIKKKTGLVAAGI